MSLVKTERFRSCIWCHLLGVLSQESMKSTSALGRVLAMPVIGLRMVGCWQTRPGSDTGSGIYAASWFISRCWFPASVFMLFIYVGYQSLQQLIEHKPLLSFISLADGMSVLVLVLKMFTMNRNIAKISLLRDFLQEAFDPYERKYTKYTRQLNEHYTWLANWLCVAFTVLYFCLSMNVLLSTVIPVFGPKENRKLPFDSPKFLLENDWMYFIHCFIVQGSGCFCVCFFPAAFDCLYLSLCLHIKCKHLLLQYFIISSSETSEESLVYLKLRKHKNKSLNHESNRVIFEGCNHSDVMRFCVQYHGLIIHMKDQAEELFSGPMMLQLSYALVAIGVPALRLFYENNLDTKDTMYLITYASFNFSQLLFVCWFGDLVAESASQVADSTLRGYKVGADKDSLRMLQMIMMRTQKTFSMTANNFVALNLELFLKIVRRSQSIYSTVLNMARPARAS